MSALIIFVVLCATIETIVRGIAKLLFAAAGMILRLLFFKSRS